MHDLLFYIFLGITIVLSSTTLGLVIYDRGDGVVFSDGVTLFLAILSAFMIIFTVIIGIVG